MLVPAGRGTFERPESPRVEHAAGEPRTGGFLDATRPTRLQNHGMDGCEDGPTGVAPWASEVHRSVSDALLLVRIGKPRRRVALEPVPRR
jgi:hypothetical protein